MNTATLDALGNPSETQPIHVIQTGLRHRHARQGRQIKSWNVDIGK